MPDGGGPAALLTDNGSDTLSVVDLAGPALIGRYPVGHDPIAIDGPHHLAVDETARVVYIAYAYPPPTLSPGPHAGHGESTLRGVVVKLSLDNLRELARNETDFNPGDIVLTPDRRRVLVSHFNLLEATRATDGGVEARYGTLRVFAAGDLRAERTARVCVMPHGIAVSPDSRTAYVACNGSDEIGIVALDGPERPVQRVPVGPAPGTVPAMRYGPYGVTLSPDGRLAYVNCLEGKELRVLDLAMDPPRVTATVPLRASAMFPAFGAGDATLVVPTQAPDAVMVVRRDTLEVAQVRTFTRAECMLPHQAARGPDGRIYLVCEGDHRGPGALLTLDPTDPRSILSRVELGVYPDAIQFVGGRSP
jgi:DNA-binding beta-propeller fold protein YncE